MGYDDEAARDSVPAAPPPPLEPTLHVPNRVAPAGFVRRVGKTRNPWGVWLLSFVTLGIYGLYWYYKVNEEARNYDPRINVSPGLALLTIMFGGILCGIPPIVSLFRTGERIGQAQQRAGRQERCSGLIGLLLALCAGTYLVYYQSQLNKVWDTYGNPLPGSAV